MPFGVFLGSMAMVAFFFGNSFCAGIGGCCETEQSHRGAHGGGFGRRRFAFVVGLLLIRRMRRSITEEGSFPDAPSSAESFRLHMYHAVIQQLKQQKHELQSSQR